VIVKTLTYVKQYVVTVVDSAGNPKADVTLGASVDLPNYRKGRYDVPDKSWVQAVSAVCVNEDTNRNGVLDGNDDLVSTGIGNGDGQLWPRKPDVSILFIDASGNQVTSTKTAADGTAILQIEYAQDHASWVDALITVTASGVSGSEGRASHLVAPVPVPADPLTDTTHAPAFVVSPYGTASLCTDSH
jgi:hypothetical protein